MPVPSILARAARRTPALLAVLALAAASPAAAQMLPGPYGQPGYTPPIYGQPGFTQPCSIVGVWSAVTTTPDGRPNGSLFVQIAPGGGFALRTIVRAGTMDYVGGYQFNAGMGVLTFVVNGYQPTFLPPMFQPGTPYRFQLRMQGPNTLLLQDGGGLVELHRQA